MLEDSQLQTIRLKSCYREESKRSKRQFAKSRFNILCVKAQLTLTLRVSFRRSFHGVNIMGYRVTFTVGIIK